MPSQNLVVNCNQNTTPTPALYGALIDEQGHEVPITEHMIQEACQVLDNCVEQALSQHG